MPAALTTHERAALVAAIRRTLESVALRTRETSLIVPDSAVRVLLLDFDALPTKAAEALPIVRFRLKKLLPFDADHAAISYQVMTSSRGMVRVLAVAMPNELLAEYESIVREAGFEPGAVLSSTLAVIAALPEDDTPALIVNAGPHGITTAIARSGVLLLHRSVELGSFAGADLPRSAAAERFAGPIEAAVRIQTAELERELAAERGHTAASSDFAQAVSVAAAYYEDTLNLAPRELLASGTLGAGTLQVMLSGAGVGPLAIQEMVQPSAFSAGVSSQESGGRIPSGWLAGVRGALAS